MADRAPIPRGLSEANGDEQSAEMIRARLENEQERLRTELSRIETKITQVVHRSNEERSRANEETSKAVKWHRAKTDYHLDQFSHHRDCIDKLKDDAASEESSRAHKLARDIALYTTRRDNLRASIEASKRARQAQPSEPRQPPRPLRRPFDELDLIVRRQIAPRPPTVASQRITTSGRGDRSSGISEPRKRWPGTWPNTISDSFPVVVNIDGQPKEISCVLCGANCGQDGAFFDGLKGLHEHLKIFHNSKPDLNNLEAWCKLESMHEIDVDSLEQGHHPYKRGINRRKPSRCSEQDVHSAVLSYLLATPDVTSTGESPLLPCTETASPVTQQTADRAPNALSEMSQGERRSTRASPLLPRTESTASALQQTAVMAPKALGETGQGRADDNGGRKRRGETPEADQQGLRSKRSRNQLRDATEGSEEDKENQPERAVAAER